jgi:hypothetical protein
MEIERKWMVKGWPEAELPLLEEHSMRQGYLTVEPTVRIREEKRTDGECSCVLCFKTGRGIAREELEIVVRPDEFRELERMIGLPLIPKVRRSYQLPDGLHLEVNHVDEGLPTEFWYAEIEYPTVEAARTWDPSSCGLSAYLDDDVTDEPDQTMGAYWIRTRLPG